ncbi:MAG: ATPase family associated with various cellular activities (AAA) [Euryarchaeota archaeon ADurb.BinA087]|nr:MAG: ATPase family associated with various cellular activities (AAA) [Euryarchaeota archaeon ADurb.BinA087]
METRITDQELSALSRAYDRIRGEISRYIVGNQDLLEIIFIGLLAEGHVLVEGIPGTAKSTLVKATAQLMGCEFRRVQCGIDTQPADVIGVRVWDSRQQEFVMKKGPLFSNILLVDEINRLPPKSQSAFIEAMGERQATIDGITMPIERPYIAIATQNPLEREGTFPLIEAQKDRFMFSHRSAFLEGAAELEVIRREHTGELDWPSYFASLSPVLQKADLLRFSQALRRVHVEEPVLAYIRDLVMATREHSDVELGVSARGSIALVRGAKVRAAIANRNYVIPDDVKELAPSAFQHRLLLTREAELSGIAPARVVQEVIGATGVP